MKIRTALLLLLATACGDSATNGPVTRVIELVSPATNIVAAGDPALTLTVRLTDPSGSPLEGVTVDWTVGSGGAVVPAQSSTDAAGNASTAFTATQTGTITVRAGVSGAAPVDFLIQVTAGAPAVLARTGGHNQAAIAGEALTAPLVVTVRDAAGNLVPGATVQWVVTSGGGSITASSVTDGSGRASAAWATGPIPGSQSVTATLAGVAANVTFNANTTAGVAFIRSVAVPANYGIHDQYVRDGLVFVSAWNTGLIIYDVGNGIRGGTPALPVEVSRIITSASGVPGGPAVHNAWWFHAPSGDKRYVFVGQEGPGTVGGGASGDIHVVDVSNILVPVEVATYRVAGAGAHNFWMDEAAQILYAAYYNGGVVALDVSGTLSGDLASREIDRIQPAGAGTYVWGVQLHNGSLYATDMLSGFWQLGLVGNAFQVLGGGNNVPDRFGSDQWVHGSYAYSGTWGNRAGRPGNALKIWSLGAGGAPTLVDSLIVPGIGTVSDVEVSADGRMLMFSAENGPGAGIYFYSLVADPSKPQQIAFYPVNTGVHTATMSTIGGRRYIFAARNPASPALLILDVTSISP